MLTKKAGKMIKINNKILLIFIISLFIINKNLKILIFSSSVVERSAVNRLVLGSSPSWGVYSNIKYLTLFLLYSNKNIY